MMQNAAYWFTTPHLHALGDKLLLHLLLHVIDEYMYIPCNT